MFLADGILEGEPMDVEAFNRRTSELIDKYGWAVMYVAPRAGESGCRFAYTVGLTARDLPEFAIAGLDHDLSIEVLNDVAGQAVSGTVFSHGQQVDEVIEDFGLIVIDGTNETSQDTIWPGAALQRYGSDVRLFQLVWPDMQGNYPWDEHYSIPADEQPVLATP